MAQLSGLFRLGRDAELRHTPKGDAVCNLSLAYTYGMKGSDGKRPSGWIDASLWGKLAEALQPYLVKGGQVYAAIGDVHIETYQGKNGEGHKLVGRINEIELAGSRQDGQRTEQNSTNSASTHAQNQSRSAPARDGGAFDDMTDDIPF